MKTPFEAGKTAKELGIDTSRKFVVVEEDYKIPLKKGDVLMLEEDDGSLCPRFRAMDDTDYWYFDWSRLAYADDVAEPEAYKPRVGDRVSLEGEITESNGDDIFIRLDGGYGVRMYTQKEHTRLKLLSRKTRTLTRAEAEALLTEKLGESVRIEN